MDDPGRDPPRLDGEVLDRRLGSLPAGEDGARFQPAGLLGAGGIGRVVSVVDRNLRREIAVKTLLPGGDDAESAAALITEARITASLEHPGIVPVHDLDLSADGQIYYAMRRIHGRSLGALVADALRTGERPEPIADANPLVTILLKVCDALGYAHSRGVVHRDLKPDNIMIGDYGEVLVLDWGASSVLPGANAGPPAPSDQFGTPAFMSPEQARGEAIDGRSDVWSLGATLFNVLFLRYPFDHADHEAFWTGKRAGTVTPPAPGELHALNRPLAAIALRAMRADPARRYQTVAAFASDLRAYQAGHAMVAYRGSPWERLRRWHRRWGRALWTTIAVCALLATAAWFAWGERLKRIAAWGQPIVAEAFADETWRQRWTSEATAFAMRDGRLLSTAGTDAWLWMRQPLAGPVAIEFDGEITSGSRPCDLSAVWCDGPLEASNPRFPRQGWLIQAGAYDNSFCAINRILDGRQTQVARASVRLVPGRVHHIRAEIDGCVVRLLIDGELAVSFEDVVPIQPGHVGVYAYYAGKALDNLRVYARGLPERMSPISLGDDSLYDGLYPRAIERYRRVLTSHPSGPLADEAWYKIGYSQRLAGDEQAAWASWSRVTEPPYRDRVACHELERLFDAGRHDELLTRLPEVAARSPAAHAQAEGLWSKWVDLLMPWNAKLYDRTLLERYLAIRHELFDGSPASVCAYGRGLNVLSRWEETVTACGDDPLSAVEALSSLGRPSEGVRRFGNVGWYAPRLRREAGDLMTDLAAADGDRPYPLCKLGRLDEALRDSPKDWRVLASLGRWTELLQADDDDARSLARIGLGRADEAAAGAYFAKPHPSPFTLALLGRQDEVERTKDGVWCSNTLRLLARLNAGDRAGAAVLRREVAAEPLDWAHFNAWFGPLIVVPLLDRLDGRADAWDRALTEAQSVRDRAGQRLWHLAGFVSGRLSTDALLAQPFRSEADAWLRLGTGLRADAAGDAAGAREAYRTFQALPLQRRLLRDFTPDPAIERFVVWRLQALR